MTEEEGRKAYRGYQEYKRKRAIKAVFKGEWSYEITDYNYFVRCFSVVKTLLCLLLHRTHGTYLDSDMFCIMAYDQRNCMESQSWDAVWVSPKLFSGWQVCCCSDGT